MKAWEERKIVCSHCDIEFMVFPRYTPFGAYSINLVGEHFKLCEGCYNALESYMAHQGVKWILDKT